MATKNSRPINDLAKSLRESLGTDNDSKNVFDFLKGSVVRLIESNITIQENLEKQIPLLQAMFFDRLLNGSFSSLEEAQTFKSQNKLSQFEGRNSVVIVKIRILHIDSIGITLLNELNMVKIILKDLLINLIKGNVYIHDVDFHKMALLINYQGKQDQYKSHIEEVVNNIQNIVKEKLNVTVVITAGNIVYNLLEINRSYQQAKEALEYKACTGSAHVRWYEDIPTNSRSYFYPGVVYTYRPKVQ